MRLSQESKHLIEGLIKKVINGEKTRKFVAKQIGTSEKTIGKWCKEFKLYGTLKTKVGFAHNKIPLAVNEGIVNFFDHTMERIADRFGKERVEGIWRPTLRYVAANFDCSIEHVRKVLIDNNRLCHRTQKKTIRAIRKSIKELLENEKDFEKANQLMSELEEVTKHRLYVGKSGAAGYRIETDGCFDHWIDHNKSCLYVAIDSMTGTLLNVHMEKEETSIGHLILLKETFHNHGLPVELNTDKRGGLYQGRLGEAIQELGINHQASSEPTFKPNVERANEDMQAILPLFILDHNINSINDFNARKAEVIAFYNKHNNRKMPDDNCFVDATYEQLEEFVIKENKKVANEVSHVSIDGKKYAPFRDGKRILMDREVIVRKDIDNRPFLKLRSEKIYLQEIKDEIFPDHITKKLREINDEKKKGMSFNRMLDRKIQWIKDHGSDVELPLDGL